MSESQRLRALQRLQLLDSPPEARFDRIALIAAKLFACPSSAIGLVDRSRLWLKAAIGTTVAELPRELALADLVVRKGAPLFVEDARTDGRVQHCAAVAEPPRLRFYAGHPLFAADGSCVGVLCAFKPSPGGVRPEQIDALRELAAAAEAELQQLEAAEARRQLEASERRYRALVENNPDAVYTIDTDGRISSCNDALQQLTGYSREALLGSSFDPLVCPDDLDLVRERFQQCLAGTPVYLQTSAKRADGSFVHVSISASPYVVDGQRLGVVGVSRDITDRVLAERRLRESEQRLALALEAGRQGVWEWDVQHGRTYQSGQLRQLLGHPATEHEESIEAWAGRIHPDDRGALSAVPERLDAGEDESAGECRLRHADGSYRWFRYHVRVIVRTPAGGAARVIGTTEDVHERRLARQERQREVRRMALAVKAGGIGIFEEDLRSGHIHCDARTCSLFGLDAEGVTVPFDDVLRVCHPDDRERLRGLHQALRAGQQESVEVEFRIGVGDVDRHLRVLGSILEENGDAGPTLIGTCWDVTEARQLQQRLHYQATHDPLTGLYNRRKFEQRLKIAQRAACNPGRAHLVCFIDLDRFKIINDTLGHVAGDALLRDLARLLDGAVQRPHTLARLGGDEFGLLLMNRTPEEAEQVVLEVVHQIERFAFHWEGRTHAIGASVGIAELGEGPAGIVEAMSQADVACYSAKTAGRGRISVYRPGDSDARQRHQELRMVKAIREALAEDRLCLHAQEIRATEPERLGQRHYELLVRMQDTDGRLVPPGAFIPAAELYGLMAQVDRWVLREALQRHGPEIAADPALVVGINLSAQSLNDTAFADFILELLRTSAVRPEQIQFEVTETAVVANLAAAATAIQALRELGCAVALDDFGAGSSSFAYLKHFAVDCVKIDGSFIKNLCENPTDRIIVESIHQLARKLGARTIAEYVENEELLAQVRMIGIDYAQGYGIARPVPLEEVL